MCVRSPRIITPLLASLVAMMLGLAGLAAMVVHSTRELASADELITGDTAPSILAAQNAAVHLSELHMLAHELIADTSRDRALVESRIAAKRAALTESVQTYLTLPQNAGEAHIHAELHEADADFDRVLARVLAARDPHERALLGGPLDGSVAKLNSVLLRAVALNIAFEESAVGSIREIRRSWLPGAVMVQAVSTLAAAFVLAITHQVSTQNRRLLEARSAELEAFTGRVAHDLLSPLMTVSLALAAAEPALSTPDRARVRAMVTRAAASLQRVRAMVTDLLDFARAGAMPPPGAEVDAGAVPRGVVEDLAPAAEMAHAELCLEIGTTRRVRCSSGALTSVLANLVQNALKFLDGAGERRVVVRAVDAGQEVRFEVEDTGPGIAPEDQARIFEPYERVRNDVSGLGLGLATVKRLAEAHGGHVGVRSEVGQGAVFWVTLPAV